MMSRYKHLLNKNYVDASEYEIDLSGETRKVGDVIDNLVDHMNIIYRKIILDEKYDENDDEYELYQSAQELFGNPTGLGDGGTVYGIQLHGLGGAVMGIGVGVQYADQISLTNVNIHDLAVNPIEKAKFKEPRGTFAIRGPFADIFDVDKAAETIDDQLYYKGTAFSDAQLAFSLYETNWYSLSHSDMPIATFHEWAKGRLGIIGSYAVADVKWSCNTDIQLHIMKGPIGLRIDGVDDVSLKNIDISNLLNIGELGDEIKCSNYSIGNGHQFKETQLGYTGTDIYGMLVVNSNVNSLTDIKINNIESYNGVANGLTILKDSTVTVIQNENTNKPAISINNILAGTQLPLDSLTKTSLPNKYPIACGVTSISDNVQFLSTNDDISSILQLTSISGHDICGDQQQGYNILFNNVEDEDIDLLIEAQIKEKAIKLQPPIREVDDSKITLRVESACNNLENGIQYIKPYSNNDNLLPVRCKNGWTIIDPSLNIDQYSLFFSSIAQYDVGVVGPELDDFVTWQEWWLPEITTNSDYLDLTSKIFHYRISQDCSSSCIDSNTQWNGNGNVETSIKDMSVYYMTGNFYLCAWITKGDCDMDAETYECYSCGHSRIDTNVYPGVCSHLETVADYSITSDHFECTGSNDNVKPSIGINSQYCVCYQPSHSLFENTNEQTVYQFDSNDELTQFLPSIDTNNDEESIVDSTDDNIVHLSSENFVSGTYRITESGKYILTEDIVINFMSPSLNDRSLDDFSPNSYEKLYWMPDSSQEETYPGASTWSGSYQLGFFTGISIETSFVTIDLNGFEIGMSDEFYLQQRFFSIIELAKKNFVSGQGPVDFGPYLNSASNVIIKNGIIGKTSHHGIHGNGNTDIKIEDLKIHNFDVAGIQLNGYQNVQISNVDVGPCSQSIPVTGRYLHARALLSRYASLVEDAGDEEITFANRDSSKTVEQYVDELIEQMNLIYYHIIDGKEYNENNDEREYIQWLKAKKLFLNDNDKNNGISDGGVVYGILLNSRGGAVMGFGNAPGISNSAKITNVKIHGLKVAPLEKFKFKTDPLSGATRGPVADVFDFEMVSDWDSTSNILESNVKYIGTAFSDVQIAMSEFEKSWYVLDHTCVDYGVTKWAISNKPITEYSGGCNTDIQLHINKGSIGLRIDNTDNFEIENVLIDSIENIGLLGNEAFCGRYEQGNAHQDPDITAGYTGTESYGITITGSTNGKISNVKITKIASDYGVSKGIAIFKDSSTISLENVKISNINAGKKMEYDLLNPDLTYLPNKIPQACSVYNNHNGNENIIVGKNVKGSYINGFAICTSKTNSLLGECENCNALYSDLQIYDEQQELLKSSLTNNINQKIISIYIMIAVVTALILCACGGFCIFCMKKYYHNEMIKFQNSNKHNFDGIHVDETTGLLNQSNQYNKNNDNNKYDNDEYAILV